MTQSGQGEEPSARPAHEGIVLPSDGGEPLLPGMTSGPGGQVPAPVGGQAWGQPWGPDQQSPQHGQGWQTDPSAQSWDSQQWGAQAPAAHPGAGPLPPEGAPAPSYGDGAPTAHSAPYAAEYGGYGAPHGAPGGPAVDEGATQFLPPVGNAAVDEGATQYIPPVVPGAMPPGAGGDPSARFPGHMPQGGVPGHNPDAEATQFIAPVDAQAGGGWQTPAEFDNLFRNDSGGAAPATQQLPSLQQPAFTPPGGYDGGYDGKHDGGGGRGGRRTGSRVPLIATVGVGIVALGIGAGALLSGGGGDSGDNSTTVSATAPATDDASPSSAADPAREQAVALDKLLADSGSSRSSVIKAVDDVRNCRDLDQAASDLRDAAEQRKGLVTSLDQLSVDKLPGNAELTQALTKAWKASESADLHYAAWADQTRGKKGCKKGQARITGERRAGDRESGTASAEKAKAAQLWNEIAKTYGLTQRQPTQL
ncbi:hypothetical protein ACFYNZ_16080 [Streptomyces kebangsaanensis]|uniref:Uncharacterized protein n=1 Tax=Streptomyces kebangsaanensis TaxID=864058 RepID=A0ABW6KSZ3_9ACTN